MHQHPVLPAQARSQHGLQAVEHTLSTAVPTTRHPLKALGPSWCGPHIRVLRRHNQPARVELLHLRQRLNGVHDHGLARDPLVLLGLCRARTAARPSAGNQGVKKGICRGSVHRI